MQPAISVEQRSVSFFRHRDAQPTLLHSGVARRVGVVRFALRFAHRVHVVEQPGAWAVLRSLSCVEKHITGIVFAGSGLLLGIVFRTI